MIIIAEVFFLFFLTFRFSFNEHNTISNVSYDGERIEVTKEKKMTFRRIEFLTVIILPFSLFMFSPSSEIPIALPTSDGSLISPKIATSTNDTIDRHLARIVTGNAGKDNRSPFH